jgi:hypothetical protein
MRSFKTPSFEKDAGGSGLSDAVLVAAVHEIEAGLINAHLGAGLVKKRIARSGGGKSGGYRTIIAHRQGDRVVFLHLFAKNEKASVTKKELAVLKLLAKNYMSKTPAELDEAVRRLALSEIKANVSNP